MLPKSRNKAKKSRRKASTSLVLTSTPEEPCTPSVPLPSTPEELCTTSVPPTNLSAASNQMGPLAISIQPTDPLAASHPLWPLVTYARPGILSAASPPIGPSATSTLPAKYSLPGSRTVPLAISAQPTKLAPIWNRTVPLPISTRPTELAPIQRQTVPPAISAEPTSFSSVWRKRGALPTMPTDLEPIQRQTLPLVVSAEYGSFSSIWEAMGPLSLWTTELEPIQRQSVPIPPFTRPPGPPSVWRAQRPFKIITRPTYGLLTSGLEESRPNLSPPIVLSPHMSLDDDSTTTPQMQNSVGSGCIPQKSFTSSDKSMGETTSTKLNQPRAASDPSVSTAPMLKPVLSRVMSDPVLSARFKYPRLPYTIIYVVGGLIDVSHAISLRSSVTVLYVQGSPGTNRQPSQRTTAIHDLLVGVDPTATSDMHIVNVVLTDPDESISESSISIALGTLIVNVWRNREDLDNVSQIIYLAWSVPRHGTQKFDARIGRLLGYGAVIFTSAGDNSADASFFYPGCDPRIICVGACDDSGVPTHFSNHGIAVTLYEVGVDVSPPLLETGQRLQGTSYATTYVIRRWVNFIRVYFLLRYKGAPMRPLNWEVAHKVISGSMAGSELILEEDIHEYLLLRELLK